MDNNNIQQHQRELCTKLWSMANALRGNMEAYEFKNYILGMIFYYYLSNRTEEYMAKLLKDDNITYEEAWKDEEYKQAIDNRIGIVLYGDSFSRNGPSGEDRYHHDASDHTASGSRTGQVIDYIPF